MGVHHSHQLLLDGVEAPHEGGEQLSCRFHAIPPVDGIYLRVVGVKAVEALYISLV
jgi:hypothetical protein